MKYKISNDVFRAKKKKKTITLGNRSVKYLMRVPFIHKFFINVH